MHARPSAPPTRAPTRGRRTAEGTARERRRRLAAAARPFAIPIIEYGELSPILIVFGAAVVSACSSRRFVPRSLPAPRPARRSRSSALVVALVAVVLARARHARGRSRPGSVAVDGPRCSCRARSWCSRSSPLLLFAERRVDPAGDAFAPRARRCRARTTSSAFTARGWLQTEVCPLVRCSRRRHAALPRGQRPADDVRRARGPLAAAVPAVRRSPVAVACSRRRPRSSTSCSARSRRRSSSTASALLYGYAGTFDFAAIADALRSDARPTACSSLGVALVSVGLLFKIGAAPFHQWTPDVYQGAPTPVTGVHGRLHEGRRVRRAAAGPLRRARRGPLGLAADAVRRSPSSR